MEAKSVEPQRGGPSEPRVTPSHQHVLGVVGIHPRPSDDVIDQAVQEVHGQKPVEELAQHADSLAKALMRKSIDADETGFY